jgi:putative transposase
VLSRLVTKRGAPRCLRLDNGPEFVGHKILEWLTKERVDTALIDAGNPATRGR